MELVAPNRKICRVGKLHKVNRRGGTDLYTFHLFSDMMTYSEQTALGRFKLHRRMDLRTFRVVDSQKKQKYPDAFEMLAASKSFVVIARSAADKVEWMASIDEILKNLKQVFVGLLLHDLFFFFEFAVPLLPPPHPRHYTHSQHTQ